MRPYSLYLDGVKSSLGKKFAVNLAGTTPPIPRVPAKITFDPTESRRSGFHRVVLRSLAKLNEAAPERLKLTIGSSSAFLHALSAVTRAGDTVMIETPTYEPFVMTARYLGLKVVNFARTGDFSRDIEELKKKRSRAKVLILSNPSSPAGWLYSKSELARISRLFSTVIVDEIFLPVFAGEMSRTGSLANVISLSGLSKTLGLSSLRVGWMKASPQVLRESERIALNTYVDVPTLSLTGASLVLPRFWEIVESHKRRADANRAAIREFAADHPGVLSHDFSIGHFGVMKVPRGFTSGEAFARVLERKSISVCPCEPFGMKNAIRFNLLAEPRKFSKALAAITSFYPR